MLAVHVVVVYDHLLAPGGVPYETRALIGGLLSNGAKVTALCNPRVGLRRGTESAVIADFDSEDDSDPPVIMDYGLASLTNVLRTEDRRQTVFFLIGCRRAEYLIYARAIRRFEFRSVVFPHGLLAPELLDKGWHDGTKGWLRRLAERVFQFAVDRPLLRNVTMSRALSAFEAKRLQCLGAEHVFVTADGVDRSWLAPPAPEAAAPRGRLKLLYLGRPEPFQKGLDIVLRAIDGLTSASAIELTLAGPDKARFRRIVVEALGRFPTWVTLAGMVSGQTKRQVITEAHFLVHVSRFEGMAKCVREAAGAGLPVLASFESNFGDWVQATGAGLATVATEEAVRDVVGRATLVTPGEWTAMREAAWRFAVDHSWEKVAARVLSEIARPTSDRALS